MERLDEGGYARENRVDLVLEEIKKQADEAVLVGEERVDRRLAMNVFGGHGPVFLLPELRVAHRLREGFVGEFAGKLAAQDDFFPGRDDAGAADDG